MKKVLFGILFFLVLAAPAVATDWPVWTCQETGRVAVATTTNTYTACTQIPFTKAWNYLTARVESVLNSEGNTIPGNSGLAVRFLEGTAYMPVEAASISSGYDLLLPNEAVYEDREQSTASVKTYYANTTITAAYGLETKINLVYKTWKINRK